MIYVVQSGDSLTSIAVWGLFGTPAQRQRPFAGTAPGARAGIGCFHSEGDLPG